MKKRINLLRVSLFLFALMSLASCNKKEEMTVLVNSLWFPEEACVQELAITANCKWSINIDDGADWYTIDPMSGRNNKVLSITVKALGDAEQRTSSFTITSDKGNVQLKVRVSQNTDEPAELRSIENMVFGVATFTHWNVDYFGEVIEETYKRYEFNPLKRLTNDMNLIQMTRRWVIICFSWKTPSAYKKTATRTVRCTISLSTFMTPMLVSSISILLLKLV